MSIKIEVSDSFCSVTKQESDGISTTKFVDPEELATALSRKARLDTGLLPLNTRYFSRSGSLISVLLEVRPHVRKFYTVDTTPYTAPLPGTVFKIIGEIKDSKINIAGTNVLVYKDPVITPDTELFNFPYGNVFINSAICWGSIKVAPVKEIIYLGAVVETFLGSVFNGHLASQSLSAPITEPIFKDFKQVNDVGTDNIGYINGVSALKWLSKKEVTKFPNDWLTKSSYIKNIKDFISSK